MGRKTKLLTTAVDAEKLAAAMKAKEQREKERDTDARIAEAIAFEAECATTTIEDDVYEYKVRTRQELATPRRKRDGEEILPGRRRIGYHAVPALPRSHWLRPPRRFTP